MGKEGVFMSSSSLLRLAGLSALLGAVLLVIVGFTQPLIENLFLLNPGSVGEGVMATLYIRSGLGLLGRTLLALGLVGLYVRQAEATGALGLTGFVVAFFGIASPAGFEWGAVLTGLGWALFGVASLRARVYPRPAAVLLIIGAVVAGLLNQLLAALVVGSPGSTLTYALVGAEVVRNVAVGWLGYALFSRRISPLERPQLVSRVLED
jgi:hypothetical protein